MPKVSELKGTHIKVTDPDHLIAMGKTHGLLKAIEALEDARKEMPTTGIGLAVHVLKALEAENRVVVMQENFRLIIKSGIDLDAHNIFWDGSDELVAEPKSVPDGRVMHEPK